MRSHHGLVKDEVRTLQLKLTCEENKRATNERLSAADERLHVGEARTHITQTLKHTTDAIVFWTAEREGICISSQPRLALN